MITANQWYNIAQTAQVGTKSGIRIDFGIKYALFKVSVDYGNAVIAAVESNITAEETRLSVRIRYNNSAWFVDVRFSVSQETTLSAATYDNTGWEAVSPNTSVAGNTICIINDLTSLIRPSGGGESLFELMNVGTAEVPRFAVVPKKYNGVEVGIISNTFISMAGFEEPDDDTPVASSSLGDLLDVQITDPKSKDVLTYDEDLRKWVNGPGGLDETALGNYLTTNKYITQDALTGALNGYVTNEIYNTAITALNLRLTELETAFKEWFYYDDVNKAIRTKLSLIVDGTLSVGAVSLDGGTEVASGKLADLLDVQITDPASGQILLYNEEKGLWVNGSAGLNEEQLEAYLKGKDYATNSALSSLQTSVNTLRTDFDNLNTLLNGNVGGIIDTWNEVVSFLDGYSQSDDLATILSGMNSDIANRVLIEDFEKLESSVTEIAGYFTNGSANNALKLGGQLPSYYATADALNGVKNDLTSISNRVKTFEDIIGIDSNGDVYIKGTRNFYTEGGTISMFGLGEGDSGEVASVSIKFEGSDVLYNPINGVITLPAYPSGGGVADSVDWANVANKPTTLGGYGITDAVYGSSGDGFAFLSLANGNIVHYGDDGNWRLTNKPWNLEYVILHHLNYSDYALPLSGGELQGTTDTPLYLNGTDGSYIGFRNSAKSILGYFGFDSAQTPKVHIGYNYQYAIIHSGNIGSQSVNYANGSNYTYQLGYTSVGNLTHTGLQYWFDWGENSITGYGGAYKYGLHIGSPDSNYYFQVGMSTAYNGLYGRFKNGGTLGSWREIAFTDSNVASATKLQTARTIWGQSFDGSRDVWGRINIRDSAALYHHTPDGSGLLCYIGHDYVNPYAHLYNFRSGSSIRVNDDGNICIPNGNVLIGTTTDTIGKLQVEGDIYATSWIRTRGGAGWYNQDYGGGICMTDTECVRTYNSKKFKAWAYTLENVDATYCGLQPARNITETGDSRDIWLYNNLALRFYGSLIELRNNTNVAGSIALTQGAGGYATNYISAGGGYSPNSGKYGVKILVCDQSDAQTGLGQDCFGEPYELSLITTRNGNYGQIAFGYHYVDSNTYTRVGYFDVFGNFIVTGTIAMGTLSSSSDARLKYNIEHLTKDESLAVLRQLRPSKWNWKSNGALSYGFIAQEVESVASCMVDRMNDEELGQKLYLQYNQLHAFEVGAIQYIDSEVERLKRKVNELENELKQYRLCQ